MIYDDIVAVMIGAADVSDEDDPPEGPASMERAIEPVLVAATEAVADKLGIKDRLDLWGYYHYGKGGIHERTPEFYTNDDGFRQIEVMFHFISEDPKSQVTAQIKIGAKHFEDTYLLLSAGSEYGLVSLDGPLYGDFASRVVLGLTRMVKKAARPASAE